MSFTFSNLITYSYFSYSILGKFKRPLVCIFFNFLTRILEMVLKCHRLCVNCFPFILHIGDNPDCHQNPNKLPLKS